MNWLATIPSVLATLVACGAEGKGGGSTDAGTDAGRSDAGRREASCWSPELDRPCCHSRTNADRLERPELLLVYFAPIEPAAFLSIGNVAPLVEMVQSRRLIWLFEIAIPGDGTATVRTGGGRVSATADDEYEWLSEEASPVPGRWTSATLDASFVDETFTTTPLSEPFVVPVFDQRTVLATEIEIQDLAFEDVRLSESRTCVGELASIALLWSLDVGFVTGYLLVEPAKEGVLPNLGLSLCEIMAGLSCDRPREEWTYAPDSLCDGGACEHGACDPLSTCNAYRLRAHVGAAGVEIADEVTP